MVRSVPVPSSSVKFSSFLDFLTASACLDLHGAEVALGEGIKVDELLKQRLDGNLGIINRGLKRLDEGARGVAGLGGLGSSGTGLETLLGLHVREQQHVADGSLVGEQHDHAVDTDADATRGRHTVLEGTHVILVVLHGLIVAAGLLGHLGSEALGLVDRVVELGERVRVLVTGDDQLKAVGQARIILKALGKRANLDGGNRTRRWG